tara:strand:+ start:275 stop:439 length:165 start_codon:yes stop_codon:yes gene_type:complete
MKYKNIYTHDRVVTLYNPEKEGLGGYDANYINAFEKLHKLEQKNNKKLIMRNAA